MEIPRAKKLPVTRTVHGVELKDEYAWLREKESPETIAYLEAENAYMKEFMAPTQGLQDQLYTEMVARIKEDDQSVPYKKDHYWYYTRMETGKGYAIHCRKFESLEAEEEILLDENELAEGTDFFDLGDLEVSPNEFLMAFTVDTEGNERYALYVKDLKTGEIKAEKAVNISPEIEWANDNATIFYITLDAQTHRPNHLYRYQIGSEESGTLVWEEPDEAFFLNLYKTKDERYFFLYIGSNITTEMYYFSADEPLAEPKLFQERRHDIEFGVEHHEGWFYIYTNDNALNFRLMRAEAGEADRDKWEEVIPHDPEVKIDTMDVFKDYLVVYLRRSGLKSILVRNLRTGAEYDVPFNEPVYTVWHGTNLEFDSTVLRFNYSSLTVPTSVYDFDLLTQERRLLKQQAVLGEFDATKYVSERHFAPSEDGTLIPVSIVYRKDMRREGPQPLYLYAYGSYGVTVDPYFRSTRLSLLDRGMIFAIANIRGGGALGEGWYRGGKFLKKKKTFEDFIGAAEFVIGKGYTDANQLAVGGGSAGGMLMGAVANDRPDLFKAVVAHVPFVDVINTMLDPTLPLTVPEYDEWGNPAEKEYFDYMLSYSPYDNVRAQAYPEMLVTAGLNDPRVHYWEPAKWVARLRDRKTDDKVLLLKTNMDSGHQGASGRYEHLKEVAFDYAFLLTRLGIVAMQPAVAGAGDH